MNELQTKPNAPPLRLARRTPFLGEIAVDIGSCPKNRSIQVLAGGQQSAATMLPVTVERCAPDLFPGDAQRSLRSGASCYGDSGDLLADLHDLPHKKDDMDSSKCKEFVIGCITYHFQGMLAAVEQLGGGNGKAAPAIKGVLSSLVGAASGVDARVYPDYELSKKLLTPGVDLAYRSVIVSDAARNDEWIAVLAVGLEVLDEHTRKIVMSWCPAGEGTPKRLLVYVNCAAQKVTMQPVCAVVAEQADGSIGLMPGAFMWSIPRPAQVPANLGYIELNEQALQWSSMMLSVADSANAARLNDEHVRGTPAGSLH